jgi:hypothetical protein
VNLRSEVKTHVLRVEKTLVVDERFLLGWGFERSLSLHSGLTIVNGLSGGPILVGPGRLKDVLPLSSGSK